MPKNNGNHLPDFVTKERTKVQYVYKYLDLPHRVPLQSLPSSIYAMLAQEFYNSSNAELAM